MLETIPVKCFYLLLLAAFYVGLVEGSCTKVDCFVSDAMVCVRIMGVPVLALDSAVMLYAYDSSSPMDHPVDSTIIAKSRIDKLAGVVSVGTVTGVMDYYDRDQSSNLLHSTNNIFKIGFLETGRNFLIHKFKYV